MILKILLFSSSVTRLSMIKICFTALLYALWGAGMAQW